MAALRRLALAAVDGGAAAAEGTLLPSSPSSSSSSASSPPLDDDGMVFLPRASPLVTALCVGLYVALALVALARMLSVSASASAAPQQRRAPLRRADALKRQRTFQRLLLLFALVRAASFVPPGGLARGLLNRLALCAFFSLVLFQVLFWIDIANAKVSTRSRRIWNAFVAANALFYAAVLGLCVMRWREIDSPETAPEQLARARLWDLIPVLLIALGSLAASLGLLYSTCKTRRRVGRVLRQFAEHSLPKRLNDRVEAKLQRALRVTNVIMGVCAVLFLLRTVLYLQRPFSQTQCGAIRDPDACVLIGYGLPELVPCALFLVLMWEVEPHLELPSRRKSSVNVVAVARATETTPLLLRDRLGSTSGGGSDLVTISVETSGLLLPSGAPGMRTPVHTQRPSPLSSALGGNVIAAARRRLRRVLEESFGMRSDDDEASSVAATARRVDSTRSGGSSPRSRSGSQHGDSAPPSPAATDDARSRESSGIARTELDAASGGVFVWMSFQCFHLKLPSPTDTAVVLVLHEVDAASGENATEFGRTEIAPSADPFFHVMLPVQIHEARTLRASVYAVTRPRALQDLNAQWLVGSTLLPLAAYLSPSPSPTSTASRVVAPGAASVHELRSPLSRTHASGELVVRCEAPLSHGDSVVDSERLERIARAFVYQPAAMSPSDGATTASASIEESRAESPKASASASVSARGKLLVEEELIESVYTWEMPYQLLQLILSDLLVQLDVLKRALLERGNDEEEEATLDGNEHGIAPSSGVPTRTTSAPSVGMLSEMIMQIQGDALERKSRKWGEELVAKMEQYVDDVEAAILRYESASHGGLTFKPSTMKADSGLSFLALNLHQQLVSVGPAVPASASDLADGASRADAQRYVRLVDSSAAAVVDRSASRSSMRLLEAEHAEDDALFQDSASEDEDEDRDDKQEGEEELDPNHGSDRRAPSPPTTVGSQGKRRRLHRHHSDDDVRAPPPAPEPLEALRRRVISFDSAETIVNLQVFGGPQAVPLSREQRQLAESIVALGADSVLGVDGDGDGDVEDEAEHEPDALSPASSGAHERPPPPAPPVATAANEPFDAAASETLQALKTTGVEASQRDDSEDPGATFALYGTTTVGAFAAHVYGFRRGGVRQLRGELERLRERLARESQRAGAELTVEALEREHVELQWHIDRRLEVAFSQAMSALATCFQQTLYVHLHSRTRGAAHGLAYLEQLAALGFVVSVESLLSTYSKEAGMLGDMDAAVRELARVRVKLRPVQSPRAAQFRVSVTAGPRGLTMELPLIVAAPAQFPARSSMHRVRGQDPATGAVYLALETPAQWARARRVFRAPLAVVPVLFSQGMNEMQTVANTVGKDALQREINRESLAVLERYVDAWAAHWEDDAAIASVRRRTQQLRACVARADADRGKKHMDILTLSSAVARAVGGGRVTCCKSAKDRTAMAVTLEETALLAQHHALRAGDRERVTALLRSHGVRRENARKNIGQAQYCFSALQNYLLPADYQCPPGTGGGASKLS